jgi:hypothetical protein
MQLTNECDNDTKNQLTTKRAPLEADRALYEETWLRTGRAKAADLMSIPRSDYEDEK